MSRPQVLGIIPARGGSQSIPRKSIALLAGRPLLAYTADAVRGSVRLTRAVLSTDSDEIADVGRQCGLEVPGLRPPELARSDTLMLPVVQHVLKSLADREGYAPDVIVILQPTSPLRESSHIDEAVGLLLESGADSVVSVVPVPHQYNPASVMSIVDGALQPFLPGEGGRIQRRQEKPQVYARNGPAVYAARAAHLLSEDAHLYAGVCRAYVMPRDRSIDIDEPEDLAAAESLLRAIGPARD